MTNGSLIMTMSVNIWKCFIVFGYILQQVHAGTTYTSRACYGADVPCARHELICTSTQKIAIYDAYYTDNTECGLGVSACNSLNPDKVTEQGYHRFNNTEMISLYNNCSTKRQCVYRATRWNITLTFSVVKYQCVDGGFTTEPTNKRSSASTSSQIQGEVTTWSNTDGLPLSNPLRFPVGVFMGGVAAGVVVVVLVDLAVYVLVIRRRYDLTPKKQGDTPASVEHPTYSGLSAGGDVNNYAIIEQTSRSQEDTTHGPAANPDYQYI